MARDTSGGQQHKQPRKDDDIQTDEANAAAAAEQVKERQDEITEDVDDILDEIDDVLEKNAADFVRAFVQKGGE
ncbi:MAG TPA: ubiquitin-like protein Pup [Jiangellaceae bacterium]